MQETISKKHFGAHGTERKTTVIPMVDIIEDDNNISLTADLPGVSKETLELKIENDVLHIYGKINIDAPNEYQYSEFNATDYYRAFNISQRTETEKVDASLNDGVLQVIIPKSERLKPRKIEINH